MTRYQIRYLSGKEEITVPTRSEDTGHRDLMEVMSLDDTVIEGWVDCYICDQFSHNHRYTRSDLSDWEYWEEVTARDHREVKAAEAEAFEANERLFNLLVGLSIHDGGNTSYWEAADQAQALALTLMGHPTVQKPEEFKVVKTDWV